MKARVRFIIALCCFTVVLFSKAQDEHSAMGHEPMQHENTNEMMMAHGHGQDGM